MPPGAFRLALAGLVMVSHLTDFGVGRLAVQLFFFLSGYWTATIWATKFDGRDLVRFYASRYLRIAPLYFLVMLPAAALRPASIVPANLTLLGVASAHHDPTGVSWSLDIELQFYLLAPFIIAGLRRVSPWIGLAASAILMALGFLLWQRTGIATLAMYLPPFVMGVLTFTKAWKPSERTALLSLGAFGAATVLTIVTPFWLMSVDDPFDRDIYATLWMLPLVPYAARSLTVKGPKIDRDLGNLSYPLYLVHLPALLILRPLLGHSMAARVLIVAIIAALVVGLYRLIDRPVDRWRVNLTETQKSPPAPEPRGA
jgi:peptidoglycan/LPS O-acetylase OafA/YrhL